MKKDYAYKIGIGVTEHNRPEVFAEFMVNIKKYMPEGAKLVVVDDASEVPVENATYRFEKNVGIARAKNMCFELLQDCEHIFLFDSDCWPKAESWWKPYVESKEPHLCYIFKDFVDAPLNDCVELYRDSSIVAYSHARGCMLYFHNICLQTIGGMDTNYRRWGYEHIDITNRIYNAGLTQFRYMDVPTSHDLIYSADEQRKVDSTVSPAERRPYLKEMRDYFLKSYQSKHYAPFINISENVVPVDDIVLTCYFTGQPDPQRAKTWNTDISQIQALIDSMNGQKLVVLHDCFDDIPDLPENIKFVKVETSINPYFQRWISYYQYLRDHPEVKTVFMTDATDVEMLKNPFNEVQDDKLYVGSEQTQTWIDWIIVNHPQPFLRSFLRANARFLLLNAGIVGGRRDMAMEFLRHMNRIYSDEKGEVGRYDMGLFNYVVRSYFTGRFVTGNMVHTKFKAFEKNNKEAWFKHK